MTGLREAQLEMAQFLRDPAGENPPEGIEQRRLHTGAPGLESVFLELTAD